MGRIRFIAVVLVALLISGHAWAGKRVALVIGNNDYDFETLPDLKNANKNNWGQYTIILQLF